jgi:hypothetical protein
MSQEHNLSRQGRAGVAELDDRDILYTRPDAAGYLKKSVPTLERWACQGIGPKPLRVGPRDVRYTLRSLREFVGTADQPRAA